MDRNLSSEIIPVQSFSAPEYLNDGEIAETEIAIRPLGLKWEAGETLVLRIGNEYRENLEKGISLGTANDRGEHIIHCGGNRASFIQLPFLESSH